jgi:NAD+ kinase
VKQIGVVVKNDSKAMEKAAAFEKWLGQKGIEVIRKVSFSPESTHENGPAAPPGSLFCVFVLGGDGTFLSAVRWIGDADIPIVGVKFGEVGFLAEIHEEKLYTVAESILYNSFLPQLRMRLLVTILHKGVEVRRETVLNDVVINKGALVRLANIKTEIDGQYLTTYRADGLIVATPTGSTAYSLAAGGPVIHPSVAGYIMTPICPFTLTNRPLIIPDNAVVGIQVEEEKTSEMRVTFDGQTSCLLAAGDALLIRKSPFPVKLITVPGQNYYDVLKTKLHWSGGRV